MSAAPVPPPLAAQLGLQEGFGLLVVEVMPESPAGKAGLQKFDVLRQLNDQQLVDVAQLTALVRGAGKGKEVSLTVIRKAQEQKIAVTVGEHVAPARGPSSPGFNPEMFHERFRALQEKGHDLMERMHEQGDRPHPPGPARGPEGAAPRHSGGPEEGLPPTAAISPEELLREAQPAGGAQIRVSSETSSTMLDGTKSRLRLKDGEGEIEVVAKDGQRTLTARDPQGAILFSGPVNTAEERAAVPENFRQKLAEIRVRPGNGEPREIQ